MAPGETTSPWQSWQPAEHSRAQFPLLSRSEAISSPLWGRWMDTDTGTGVSSRRWVIFSEACEPWELQSQPTPPAAKKCEPLTLRILFSQTSWLSMASNSRMLPFLPGFNDLSPLNYAPWVTVMFSDVDRWMESHLSLFGVLTESELIFCLAWLILAGSSYYFTYSLFSLSVTTEIIWIWVALEAGLTSNQISNSLTSVQPQLHQSPPSPGKVSRVMGWIKRGENILWVTADSCTQIHLTLTCQSAWGRVSEELLHTRQHNTHGCAIPPGDLRDIPGSVSGSCCLAPSVSGHTWGGKQRAFHYSQCAFPLSFFSPFFFCAVPTSAELQSPRPVPAFQCGILCCVRFHT